MKFELQQSMLSWLRNVVIKGSRTRYGGSTIKVVNAHLRLEDLKVESNAMYNKHGGIHLVFSTLDVRDSTFDMQLPEHFYSDAAVKEIEGDLQGGFIFAEGNSSV